MANAYTDKHYVESDRRAYPQRFVDKRAACFSAALDDGLNWGMGGAVVGAAGLFYGLKSPSFMSLPVSMRILLGIGAIGFPGITKYELTLFDCRSDECFFKKRATQTMLGFSTDEKTGLGPIETAAKYTVDNPFHVIGALSVPTVGGIIYKSFSDTSVIASRRAMHARVFGQAAVLGILAVVMGAHQIVGKKTKAERHAELEEALYGDAAGSV